MHFSDCMLYTHMKTAFKDSLQLLRNTFVIHHEASCTHLRKKKTTIPSISLATMPAEFLAFYNLASHFWFLAEFTETSQQLPRMFLLTDFPPSSTTQSGEIF